MTRIGDVNSIEARAARILDAARTLGWPCVVANGGCINPNEHSWRREVGLAAPGVLLEIETRLAALEAEHAAGAPYRAWEAELDRRRREDAEAAEQYEAARLRRLLGGR